MENEKPKQQKISLEFGYGNHKINREQVYIIIHNTGIDCDIPDHRLLMEAICRAIGKQMYAKGHNIPIDQIEPIDEKHSK